MVKSNKKNWMKVGGIILGIIALGTGIWYLTRKNKKGNNVSENDASLIEIQEGLEVQVKEEKREEATSSIPTSVEEIVNNLSQTGNILNTTANISSPSPLQQVKANRTVSGGTSALQQVKANTTVSGGTSALQQVKANTTVSGGTSALQQVKANTTSYLYSGADKMSVMNYIIKQLMNYGISATNISKMTDKTIISTYKRLVANGEIEK